MTADALPEALERVYEMELAVSAYGTESERHARALLAVYREGQKDMRNSVEVMLRGFVPPQGDCK